MKIISKTLKFLPLLLVVLAFQACSDDDDAPIIVQERDIVDTAISTSQLTSLVAALQAADGDLVGLLKGSGPFTVLAPNNAAFTAFLADNNFASLGDVPTDVLAMVLKNHVIAGDIEAEDLQNLQANGTNYANTSATGPGGNELSIYFNTSNGVKFNGISSVETANIDATNGTIHIVDAVIGLPTVVTFATADPNFSTLVTALTTLTPDNDYVATLSTPNGTSPAPFTVFAPTNTAFDELLVELEVAGFGDIPTATLIAALNSHVVAGANVQASGLSDGLLIDTLGADLTANITGGATLTDPNGRVSNIVATNVQAVNGVIHAIDKVVLPQL
ncbi:fasciclin domain-containing protein [Subsaximicrobium wynnwilliamsii]|uniref:Fasciclin domain-containing protein n=1 Tax=Subsaximicrobium wynnwilliamsii TaxID=291179 RepID=A0A5C6ZEU5_9FLAO|nr:fasciclin domain-containing protein [Subsaximicrobium wynnwilliamsii]TXD82779.1 fasciclin domain-containing protein [Subsaximicrobium wynnwilliamsii]TXD88503.1 fasciclin domain-containing protein [Subsaximicrobium wynnwilliamsii]TXE02501.1 fasciclin domain-containing protein [Subsaximicrobium wynnwilliamsii]